MAIHIALSSHSWAKVDSKKKFVPHDDQMWGFAIKHEGSLDSTKEHSLAGQIAKLLDNPEKFIRDNGADPQFVTGPVALIFQYGPFGNPKSWYVHGIEGTNVVSIRCPPLAEVDPSQEAVVNEAEVDVHYIVPSDSHPDKDVMLAFGHFDPKESGAVLKHTGLLIANPTRFPTLLNAQKQTVAAESGNATPTSSAEHAVFALSSTFRFHFEYRSDGTDQAMTGDREAKEGTPMQCVKFAGTYSYDEDIKAIIMQVDEAWSMRWQTAPQ